MLDSEVLLVAAALCQILLSTSFRLRHRFLELANDLNADSFSRIFEADQILFRESFKGQRHILGNKNKAIWIPVLVPRDRSRQEVDFVLDHFTLKITRT